MELNQNVLNEFCSYLKRTKYPNKIQDLILSHCTDKAIPYIHLILIQVKKSQRHMGYGSAILSEIVQLADKYNVQVLLYAADIYGTDLKRLYSFYRKHGFVLIKNNDEGKFVYRPRNKVKNV